MANVNIENLLAEILSEVRAFNRLRAKWLSVDELANYLGLKPSTIYQYVNQDRIPYRKIPGSSKLIFRRSEIDSWILSDKQPSQKKEEAVAAANRLWSKKHESQAMV